MSVKRRNKNDRKSYMFATAIYIEIIDSLCLFDSLETVKQKTIHDNFRFSEYYGR